MVVSCPCGLDTSGGHAWDCPNNPDRQSKDSGTQYGWICPKCGCVYAPWVSGCEGCAPPVKAAEVWVSYETWPPIWPDKLSATITPSYPSNAL